MSPVTGQEGDDLSGKITSNQNELAHIQSIYNILSNDLATTTNYDDISSRNISNEQITTDVSNQFDNSTVILQSVEQTFDTISSTTFIDTRQQELDVLVDDISQRRISVSNQIQDDVIDGNYTTIGGSGIELGGNVYWNGKAISFEESVTISNTQSNLLRNLIDTSPNTVTDISRDVSDIRFDFSSFTPYAPCTHILLDASESLVFNDMIIDLPKFKPILSDGGFQAKIRLSRMSKSRKILVSVPPTTTGQLSIELYDDDTFTTQSIGTEISNSLIRSNVTSNIDEYLNIADLPSTGVSYNLQQSMFVSPGTVPILDVSYNNLNTVQTLLAKDALFSSNNVQYFHNSIRSFQSMNHNANLFGLIFDVSDTYYNDAMVYPELYQQKPNVLRYGASTTSPSIGDLENLYQVTFPSMMASQTISQSLRGNRVDFHFCGIPKLVFNSADPLDPMTNTITKTNEHSSPFDYYGGNHSLFEIHLVSMGTLQHRHLAKVYITERTREQSENNYYRTEYINNLGGDLTGSQIFTYLIEAKKQRVPPYSQLTQS